eukprot:Filipodium_phascolosomae@DN1810_c0_g1_i1.p1
MKKSMFFRFVGGGIGRCTPTTIPYTHTYPPRPILNCFNAISSRCFARYGASRGRDAFGDGSEPVVVMTRQFKETSETEIRRMFGKAGAIKGVTFLTTPNGGKSGNVLVRYQDIDACQKAVEMFDRSSHQGGEYRVMPKKKEPPRTDSVEWGRTKALEGTDGCGVVVAHAGDVSRNAILKHIVNMGCEGSSVVTCRWTCRGYSLLSVESPRKARELIEKVNNSMLLQQSVLAGPSNHSIQPDPPRESRLITKQRSERQYRKAMVKDASRAAGDGQVRRYVNQKIWNLGSG